MDYKMTDRDISSAIKEETYLDEQGSSGGFKDLIPLLKALRYKAQHSNIVLETCVAVQNDVYSAVCIEERSFVIDENSDSNIG